MTDDIHFKEEILKNVRDFEEDLLKKINTKMSELNSDYKKFHQNLKNLSENNKKLIDSLTSKNLDFEKIASLEQFRNKVDSILITHEIRINNNIEEISSIKEKYDRALIENLLVPGYVGPSCQFKNIGEFIIYNLSEISKIKSEKDMMRNSFKDLRIKTDSSMRAVLNMNESLARRCNDYADHRISELKKLVYEKIDYMNTKEREIRDMINNFQEAQKIFQNNKNNFKHEIKDEILSSIDIRINESKKNQEEVIYNAVNQNNNFLEKYVNQIFETKIKAIEDNIFDIQNKLKLISKEKEYFMNKKNSWQNNNINDFPLVSSLSQKAIIRFKSENKEEKKINKNESNEAIKKNITYSNVNNNEVNNYYKPSKTYSNYIINDNSNKVNDKNTKDIKINNNKNSIISEPKLISNKLNQKNILNINFNEKPKILNETNKNNNIEKSIPSILTINKEKESSEMLLKNKNSKILIFNYDQKNHNSKSTNSKLSLRKGSDNRNEFMKNFVNIKTLKNNKDSDMIESELKEEEKTFRNVLDSLQTPKILEKRILSNNELKINQSKSNNLNNKINLKSVLNHSGSDINNYILKYNKNYPLQKNDFQYKTVENWNKNLKNWKSERNIKLNKDKGNALNLVKLELKSDNNMINGATVLANKKTMNKHITKIEYPNSFEKLYNVQVVTNETKY